MPSAASARTAPGVSDSFGNTFCIGTSPPALLGRAGGFPGATAYDRA
ncbi:MULTISPECIES: hypothetical protein [Actinomadura]|uniref:Uncharacterized protein n=1 Tax=Actinomadura yumaensis TaxID=111807 RepID=A0ABW2CWT6_9ACTN|nr:hypothetical protein [Actinomadura sp. J1-007]